MPGNRMNFSRVFGITLYSILVCFLACCSSGSGHGSPAYVTPLDAQTGRFLDSAVTGVDYSTPHWSHITGYDGMTVYDLDGGFLYQPGEDVTFSIGGVLLGSTRAKRNVTPIDLVPGAVDTSNDTVVSMCQFLQTLDDDLVPENGILITEGVRDALTDYPADFQTLSTEEVEGIFTTLNAEGVFPENVNGEERHLVSVDDALIHFEETLVAVEAEEAAAENMPFSGGIRKPAYDVILVQGQSFPTIGWATGGVVPYSAQWTLKSDHVLYQGSDPTGSFPALAPGNYVLLYDVWDSYGKTARDQRLLTVISGSVNLNEECVVVELPPPENIVVSRGDSVHLNAQITRGNPPYYYFWTYPPSATYSYTDNPLDAVFTFNTPGSYMIRIYAQENYAEDSSIDTVYVTVR
jgi:hypothetical protein